MSGKPEPPRAGASASGLHNVVVYVSGDGFGYPQQNNGNNTVYQSASTVKPKLPTQGFYNGYQGNNVNYSASSVVNQIYPPRNASNTGFPVGRREEGNFLAVMGGESGIGGTVVFPRCDSARSEVAESSCSSLSSSGGDSQSDSRTASTDNASVSVSALVPQQQFKNSAENNAVTVPFGWKRLHTNGMVIYVSPSNTALSSLDQVKAYLQTQGTCKCGLECPVKCDIVFNFDPKVATRPWSMASAPPGDLTKLCNHKRKLMAMNSIEPHQLDMKKLEAGTARKKRRPGNVVGNTGTSTGSASVSQLLAQRERERSKESAQGWSDGSTQMGREGSPMMVQGQMVTTPPMPNRSVYLPGYQDRTASHPTNHQNGTPFFRYNPHNSNVNMNTCTPTHPGQQPSQMMENNQMMTAETYSPTNTVHSPVVMANTANQNGNVTMQQNCGTSMNNGMMMNHQQQNMNFYQQQQRLHMNCSDGTETQHGHCNPMNKPVMNQQQQIILQQQQQQQQQLINQQQNHFQQHQMQHNMPQHVMNSSSSPRPQHVNQHNIVPAQHHHYEANRVNQQFHNQQFNHQEQHHLNKTMHVVQQQHCNKPQVMSVNRDSYQNRSDIPVSLHQIQQGSTMVLQTSQGQVMLPNGQTVGQTMVLHNQQGSPIQVSQSGNICQQNQQMSQGQPIQTMSLQGSSMVVQTSSGATLIPSGNQQNQMVLHGQQNSQMVQQGLQVQTIPGQQATVVLQGHQGQNIQNSQVQNNNGICTSPAMLMHHQRPAPPWQQNRNIMNQQPQQMQPNPYERVPPLHHHTPPAPVWNDDASRKKNTKVPKPATHLKKRSPYSDHHPHHHNINSEAPCPNVDVRHLPQDQNKPPTSQTYTNSIPSFMEDPSGYLAQQTALLNSTISRQTGVNNNGVNIICHSPCNQNMNDQNNTSQVLINIPTSNCSPVGTQGVPIPSNVLVPSTNKSVNQFSIRPNLNQQNGIKVYRSNSVSSTGSGVYHNQSQTGVPDSSGVSPDRGRCPQGCSTNMFDNIQHQHGINIKYSEDNPVTSSTFMDNRGQAVQMSDNRGPIQGGTVSTSNRSPVEMNRIPPDDPSPGGSSTPSSSQNCHIDASPEPPNIFISASSPYTITNPVLYTQNQTLTMSRNQEQQVLQHQKHQNINVVLQDVTSRVPTIVTTMASGHTVSSNTITSVLAGRANTATVTVNNPSTVTQSIPQNVLTNQQISQVSLPKSPLEMVQSVVSSIQVPASSASTETVLKPAPAPSLQTGHILVSSNGQLIVTNNPGTSAILSPQQNMQKMVNPPMPPMTGVSSIVTSVSGTMTQVIPTQQVLGQQTVLVNTLQAPLLFQPGVMTVDGTMNTVQIPHLAVATNNVLQGQMVEDNRVNNTNGAFSPRNQPALLSPEGSNGKRKSANKKRKVSPQTVASMLHIAAQQNSPTAGATSMVVQQQQPQQNYSNATPMLQALTILPSKGGHFGGTQQLIATANVLQPLNLVQNFPTIQQFIVPAGLGGMVMATGDGTATLLQDTVHLNVLTPVQGPGGTVFGHTSGQSILTAGPAGMVIRTPNNSQQGKMHLHPQNVTTNGGGQFIANSPNQLFMNSNAAFGGQLSPMLNVSPTNQQIHSFNTQGTNNQNRSGQPQEYIQCGQTLMVPCSIAQTQPSQNTTVVQQNTTIVQQQTTMVSNNQQNMTQSPGPSTSSSSSLSLNQHNFILNNGDNKQQNFIITADKQGQGNFILSPNPDKHQGTHIILNNISPPDKQSQSCGGFIISQEKPNQMCGNFILSNSSLSEKSGNFIISGNLPEKQTRFAKHSVSTQTAANQQVLQVSSTPVPTALVVATTNTFCQTSTAPSSYSGSPPDTTTHSPIDGGPSQSPGLNLEAPTSSVAIGSDDNLSSPTSSSDPSGRAQPMVHCVSSSNEQDSPDWTSKEGNTASSPAVFSPPVSMELMYNRNVGGALKSLSMNSYVESSSTALHYEAERIHKRNSDQELLARQIYEYGSHVRMNKRKHPFDNESRIHTSTVTTLSPQDDEDGESEVVN